jgi:hypothetical protein
VLSAGDWDVITRERQTGFSRTLERLAHGEGSPHRWEEISRRSLLGRWWERIQSRWVRDHMEVDWVRMKTEGWIHRTALWDPELALAIGQKVLSPPPLRPTEDQLMEIIRCMPATTTQQQPLSYLNRGRELTGLPPLGEADYNRLGSV